MRYFLLTILIISSILYVSPIVVTNAVMFPMCSPDNRIQVFPIFMTAREPQGSFGVAGCTYPPLTHVELYLTDDFNATYQGLPSPSYPFNLISRADGHFHQMFRFLQGQASTISVVRMHARIPGCCSVSYPFGWVRPFCQNICTSDSQGAAPFLYPGWSPDGPAGSFTAFMDAIPSTNTTDGLTGIAHIQVYFVNCQTNENIPGLPGKTQPWTAATFQGGTIAHSFIIQSNQGLDTTQYNIDAHMFIVETGQDIIFPIWVHKPVTSPCPAGDPDLDGQVSISDLATVGAAFGSHPRSSNWNPNADLNHDGVVDETDLSTVGSTLGQTCQI